MYWRKSNVTGGIGSSPRAWGKFRCFQPNLYIYRFIPTCVGQIDLNKVILHGMTVHPHVRGANSLVEGAESPCSGSSPRAWGKSVIRGERSPPLRFIPTCVGQITNVGRGLPVSAVHPHVRGANKSLSAHQESSCGSSPRAWGKYSATRIVGITFRFIPTCVGQMIVWKWQSNCGNGSSPRAWGKFSARSRGGLEQLVHPHVRGANFAPFHSNGFFFGSSPRAWGKCQTRQKTAHSVRFIPTCVGQISRYWPEYALCTVHPHVRGANSGTGLRSDSDARFIPTCVGQMSGIC